MQKLPRALDHVVDVESHLFHNHFAWRRRPEMIKSDDIADRYTGNTTGLLIFDEQKSYDDGQFTWTSSSTEDAAYTRTGYRTVDSSLEGEIDGLVRADSGQLAAQLTNQALIGDYTSSGTSDSTANVISM